MKPDLTIVAKLLEHAMADAQKLGNLTMGQEKLALEGFLQGRYACAYT